MAVLAASLCPQDPQVPPTHWSYREFHDLAGEGLVTRYPAFDFLGGRVFTRSELAVVTGDIVRLLNEKPELATAQRVERVKKLITEFEPEMKIVGLPRDLPEPAKPVQPAAAPPKGVKTFGSDVHTITINKDHADTYTRTLDMNFEGDWWASKLAGTMDTKPNAGVDHRRGDAFFTDRLSFISTERWFDAFGTVTPGLSGRLRMGDMRNTTFASGLLLGAANIDGFRGAARWQDWLDGVVVEGHSDKGSSVIAGRGAVTLLAGSLSIGLEAADIDASSSLRGGTLAGPSIFYTDTFVDAWLELVDDRDAGSGAFARCIFYYHHNLQFQADLRNYRDLAIDENSAPIYSGISGGQDEDDRGGLFKSIWSPVPALTLTGKIERAERQGGSERRTDFFAEGRGRFWKGGDVSLSYETEDVADTKVTNTLLSLGANQLVGEDGAASFSYTRDDRDGAVIHTLRDTLRYTFLKGRLTAELSHTFRKDSVGNENIFQPRVLYTLNSSVFASLRGTVSTDSNRTDTSVEFSVVIRW